MILALDTTSDLGSIALVEDGRTVEEEVLRSPDGFGHVLFQHIQALLVRHGVTVDDLDCFAAASGPGSFTGVRVGLAAVKGLAESTGKKVAAVSTLRALAWFGTAPLRATVIDARRGEVFGAVYNDRLEIAQPETVMKYEAWLQALPAGVQIVSAITAPRPLASAVGRIGWRDWNAGRATGPEAVDANYVRRSDAELFWKEKSATPSPSEQNG